jgi:hypothetical protein
MSNDFWNLYSNRVFLHYFFERHFDNIRQAVLYVNIATALATAVVLLFLSNGVALLFCSILIFGLQLCTIFKDTWEISRKSWALKYYLNESNELLAQMSMDWRLISLGKMGEEEVLSRINGYDMKFLAVKAKYLESFYFSENPGYVKAANKKADEALAIKHSTGE